MKSDTTGATSQEGGNLAAALHFARALFDGTAECVVLVDGDGQVRAVEGSATIETFIGRPLDEVVADLAHIVRDADLYRVRRAYESVVATPGERASTSFWVTHRDGHLLQLKATAINRRDDGVLGTILIRISEVEETSSSRAPAPREEGDSPPDSQRPGGLATRKQFADALRWAVDRKNQKVWRTSRFARATARDRRYDFTLVLVELDRFKMVVGGFGPQVADAVVAEVGDRLAGVLRGRDVIAHLGGGEFGLLLDAVGDVAHAKRVTDGVLGAFEERFRVGGHALAISPVIGFATSERRYESPDEVMRDAAAAAGHALSRTGRKRAAYHTDMRLEDKEAMQMIVALHEGLEKDQFTVHYQPVVRPATRQVVGFEALARWTHPRLGSIPPAKFIPLAEECGAMGDLGRRVLRQACEQAATWNAICAGTTPLFMSVNLSGSELADPRLLKDVEHTLTETGLNPEQLKLEITESVVLENLELAAGAIARLRLYGVAFSLDDFGTGFSSLSYLHKLPYDQLKIDRSFLLGGRLKNRIIIQAIVGLAQNLEIEVVAEGVESEEQCQVLQALGCDLAQGFHFAKPMPAADAEDLAVTRKLS
ncbi:MAG: EAL domain-containing protein [Deltaproteobacteria bacterium]|nr:EAL domain-containing protein [Deltaproteobacteria bacterium]